mmetsp:Transcript_13005/g.37479  ORF Transcript_13005/g.37479 Transcript_13005/m.37479 type:complete len:217 (+) Transcript_13005:2922-3572(+)
MDGRLAPRPISKTLRAYGTGQTNPVIPVPPQQLQGSQRHGVRPTGITGDVRNQFTHDIEMPVVDHSFLHPGNLIRHAIVHRHNHSWRDVTRYCPRGVPPCPLRALLPAGHTRDLDENPLLPLHPVHPAALFDERVHHLAGVLRVPAHEQRHRQLLDELLGTRLPTMHAPVLYFRQLDLLVKLTDHHNNNLPAKVFKIHVEEELRRRDRQRNRCTRD